MELSGLFPRSCALMNRTDTRSAQSRPPGGRNACALAGAPEEKKTFGCTASSTTPPLHGQLPMQKLSASEVQDSEVELAALRSLQEQLAMEANVMATNVERNDERDDERDDERYCRQHRTNTELWDAIQKTRYFIQKNGDLIQENRDLIQENRDLIQKNGDAIKESRDHLDSKMDSIDSKMDTILTPLAILNQHACHLAAPPPPLPRPPLPTVWESLGDEEDGRCRGRLKEAEEENAEEVDLEAIDE